MKKLFSFFLLSFITSISFSQIALTVSTTPVSCYGGANGSATVTASGGTGSYSYTWTPANANTNVIYGLAAGTYSVIVADASMNTVSTIFTINQPTQLNGYANSSATCFGSCNGSNYAIANGGTPPYTYSWSPVPDFGPQVYNLCPGNYSVTIIDQNQCTTMATTQVYEVPPITISFTSTNTNCGMCNGSIIANVMGGSPPYIYNWMNGSTTLNQNNLCAGVYTLIVTDGMGCTGTAYVSIASSSSNPITNITTTLTSYDETCINSGDGAINLDIFGTNPGPFTYQWSNGATTQDIVNLNSGHYYVTIIDAGSNCLTLSDSVSAIGNNCGSISGNLFIDLDNNCIKNSGDLNLTSATIIMTPGNRYAVPNSSGNYTFSDVPYGTYNISTVYNPAPLTPTCVTTLTATTNASNPTSANNNLAYHTISPAQPDMSAYAYSNGIVPGFLCHVNYNLINQAYYTGTGIFKVQLPISMISNFSSASPSTYTISGDTIMWNFSNIAYNTYNFFTVNFTVPVNTSLGSTFNTCWWIQTSAPDFYPQNNVGCYQRLVTGSFDPNDKSVSPVGVGANGGILASETDLTYLIRFQNTGNGPAHFIVVRDSLSPNLDVSTLQMLSASHSYSLQILESNVLKWRFDNIMLPDSGSNEPGSHGYIQYRIKRTNNNAIGTEIKNTAYIYFDFNEPVITNTTLNTIIIPTSVSTINKEDHNWLVYPNPNNGVLYITNTAQENKETEIQIMNAIGDVIYYDAISQKTKTLDLSKYSNGVYFIKLTSDKQTSVQRIVLSK